MKGLARGRQGIDRQKEKDRDKDREKISVGRCERETGRDR